ncbi:MAG TPA: hypothetical protein VKP88_02160 [Candidatus Paceibacterota bacterium]|nr:hypothetical protein [Candidatus Paceibacterota bacterium]
MGNTETSFIDCYGNTFTLGNVWQTMYWEADQVGDDQPVRTDVMDHHVMMWLRMSQRNINEMARRVTAYKNATHTE